MPCDDSENKISNIKGIVVMLNHLKNETNVAYSENGARAFVTTKSAVLDFFAQGGALRYRDETEIIALFTKAFGENPLLAMKALFYFRDIRGGQGERNTFRTIVKYLANHHAQTMEKNIHLISLFGRWDDVYHLFGTQLENRAGELIKEQFKNDMNSETPSLLGKWLKSENASSYETKKLARKTREILGLTPKQYRKSLSSLRKKINIVESVMTERRWGEIEYDKLPSQAGLKYRQAFFRNDEERYREFLSAVAKGEKKINVKDLFPYEIVRKIPSYDEVIHDRKYNIVFGHAENEEVLNTMWDNLPDYVNGAHENAISVIDTSGSMEGLPIEIALSIGIYHAERNNGPFKNHFISFSQKPQLIEMQGATFCEKVRNMSRTYWDSNTNIEAVFELILDTAIKHRVSDDEMVKKVYIVSDMEFDSATNMRKNNQLFRELRARFEEKNVPFPTLVFWNVNGRNAQFPMTMDDNGVQFVSGASPTIFTNLIRGNFMNPYDLMLDVLNDERYEQVTA